MKRIDLRRRLPCAPHLGGTPPARERRGAAVDDFVHGVARWRFRDHRLVLDASGPETRADRSVPRRHQNFDVHSTAGTLGIHAAARVKCMTRLDATSETVLSCSEMA